MKITSLFQLLVFLFLARTSTAQSGLYGAIDTTGQTIIPFVYENLGTPFYGLMTACKDGNCGVLNTRGEVVVDFAPAYINSYENGMARYTLQLWAAVLKHEDAAGLTFLI